MKISPLRKILSIQTVLIAVLPFFILAIIAVVWFFPRFIKNIDDHQIHLSMIIASKTESHLIRSMTILQGISNSIKVYEDNTRYQEILDSQMASSVSLRAIYVVESSGRISAVSLKKSHAAQANDLLGLDLSRNPLYMNTILQNRAVWSDTFLSLIGGGLSVALAIPANNHIVMGEIDLGLFTAYLKQLASSKDNLIMVLDRRGQVIADQEGVFTAQQLNLGHIPIVQKGIKGSAPVVEDFKLDGKAMTGCVVKAPLADWSVLVAMPKEVALWPVWSTVILFCLVLLVTILTGILLAVVLARRLAFRFENIAEHARKVAIGEKARDWPKFNITEFEELATDIQHMADAIKEREEYNRVLFADSPIPMLVMDPASSTFTDANEAALRILDLENLDTISGKTMPDFSVPDQPGGTSAGTAFRNHVQNAMANGFTTFEWFFQRAPKDQWYGDVALSVFHHGEEILLQMSIKDITKQKMEKIRRKKLEEQLRQAQKMESIGTLAGGIAHDFNNILFPVMGYTEMMMADLPDDSSMHGPMQEVLKGCIRAKDLVEQILTFSRQADKEYKPLKVNLIVKEILKLSRSTLPTTIEIQQKVSQKTGLVLADPTQIHQIVMNLVTNAFHAMEEDGGILTVELHEEECLPDSLPTLELSPGWYICLTVKDTGTGMTPETMTTIFDPYFTTKEKGKGTGLGLAVVHGIVKNYKGDIMVESEPGKGTTFKVYLPRIVPQADTKGKPKQQINLAGSGHILLVDDEKPIAMMIEQMLIRLGYEVTSRTSSPDALERFANSPEHFDLIITDMTMPNMTGDELAGEIKKIRPEIPIIMCTGFSEKVSGHKADHLPVDEILMKPVLREDLAKAVIKVLKT